MKTEIRTITPTDAENMLKLNTNNRKVRRKHVEFLRDEILGGRWQLNGASMVMSEDRLLDGQHRLMAIIAAKKAVPSLVVSGVPNDHFDTIDIGKNRTVGDVMGINGEKNAYLLAPTLSIILKYRDGTILEGVRVSTTRVQALLADNPKIRESVELCRDVRIMSVPAAAAGHFLMKKKDAALADELIEGIRNGFEKTDTDPFYDFRKRMMENHKKKENHADGLNWKYQLAFMIMAWNLRRKSQKVHSPVKLTFAHGAGLHSRPQFPEII